MYLLPGRLKAEDLEYKMDLGAAIGTCFYLGDANSTPYAHMSFMGGLTARRILNPRMAVKMNIAMELSSYDGDYGYNEKKLRLAFDGRNEIDTAADLFVLSKIITNTIQELPDVLPF